MGCVLVVTLMLGGSVGDHAGMARALEASGCEVRIEGEVRSAATMLLGPGCVTPDALVTLHLPSIDTPHWRSLMAGFYAPWLAEVFMNLPPGSPPVTLTGAQLVQAGETPCNE